MAKTKTRYSRDIHELQISVKEGEVWLDDEKQHFGFVMNPDTARLLGQALIGAAQHIESKIEEPNENPK